MIRSAFRISRWMDGHTMTSSSSILSSSSRSYVLLASRSRDYIKHVHPQSCCCVCMSTHHYIRSSSPLMLPRPRSRPSMISPSPSSNHPPVVTWIFVGSPTAGITPSSYLMPTSPTTSGPSNTTTSPTTVTRRSISPSISPTINTSLPTSK